MTQLLHPTTFLLPSPARVALTTPRPSLFPPPSGINNLVCTITPSLPCETSGGILCHAELRQMKYEREGRRERYYQGLAWYSKNVFVMVASLFERKQEDDKMMK